VKIRISQLVKIKISKSNLFKRVKFEIKGSKKLDGIYVNN